MTDQELNEVAEQVYWDVEHGDLILARKRIRSVVDKELEIVRDLHRTGRLDAALMYWESQKK